MTDPEVSRALYEKASSRDKTIKLYPGMWHGLTSGEPDENIQIVFADIIAWLDNHTGADEASGVRRPVHGSENRAVKVATTASPVVEALPENAGKKPQPRRTQSYGRYFCGLKGRRLQHHSAM